MAAVGGTDIVTEGLAFCIDAKDLNSYIPNTTTVHDLANSHIGSGSNGLSGSLGYWVYGGEAANSTGEHIDFGDLGVTNIYAIGCWFYTNSSTNNVQPILVYLEHIMIHQIEVVH